MRSAHTLLHGGGSSATRNEGSRACDAEMEDGREEEDMMCRQPWVKPGVS